jgi:hypothetical protein
METKPLRSKHVQEGGDPLDMWRHLRRGASSFGPPPQTLDVERPWLLTGKPQDALERRRRASANLQEAAIPPPPPPPLQPARLPRYRAWTEAAQLKERQQAGKSHPAPPKDTPARPRMSPCEERALPLSRHAPRILKTRKEQRNPPKWQPTAEFRVRHHAVCLTETGASASANGSGGGGGLPLAFFSPNVIKQVQASLDTKTGDGDQRQRRRSAWADDFEGESADHPAADAATAEASEATVAQRQAAGGNLQLIRITDGGWAADLSECRPATGAASGERAVAGVHVAYFPEAEDYPDPDGIDPSWALDRECALWREKAQAQARNAKLNRSVLSVVDDFFAGDVAAGFVLD